MTTENGHLRLNSKESLLKISLIAMNAVRKSVLLNLRVDSEWINLIRLVEKNR